MTLTLVWDASPLISATTCERLDVLGSIASGPAEAPWRNVTTAALWEEVGSATVVPAWLEVLHVDGLAELQALGTWLERLSSEEHDFGEATVLAWAQAHQALAIVDDREARRVAMQHGAAVHGFLWVAAQAVICGRWTEEAMSAFVDLMHRSGARYPFDAGEFGRWSRRNRLL